VLPLSVAASAARLPRLLLSFSQLKGAATVRVKNNEVKDISKAPKKEVRKMGYSYTVKYTSPDTGKVEEVALALESLGRKRPGIMVGRIQRYIENSSGEEGELTAEESHGFDVKGVLFIVLGLCSTMFCALIGQFADPKPRKAGASRVTKKRSY